MLLKNTRYNKREKHTNKTNMSTMNIEIKEDKNNEINKDENPEIGNNDNSDNEITAEEIHEEQDYEFNKYNSNYSIINMYKNICCLWGYFYNTLFYIIKNCWIYFVWIFLHYSSSHLYIYFCVPKTIWGFIISPFMTSTPHCQGLRWVVYNTANLINNMWFLFGTWICSNIFSSNIENKSN